MFAKLWSSIKSDASFNIFPQFFSVFFTSRLSWQKKQVWKLNIKKEYVIQGRKNIQILLLKTVTAKELKKMHWIKGKLNTAMLFLLSLFLKDTVWYIEMKRQYIELKRSF
jgi:hypothetical protein